VFGSVLASTANGDDLIASGSSGSRRSSWVQWLLGAAGVMPVSNKAVSLLVHL